MRHPMTLLAFLLTLALASCHRDHLYYEDDAMAAVRLMVDWEPSGMTPNGMTVLAYRQDGTLYKHFGPIATPDGCMLYLPQGLYDLVILSDTPEEYEGNMSFENMTLFEGLRAVGSRDGEHTKKLQEYLASQSAQDYCMVNPEDLGVDVVRNVEITSDEIAYYYDKPTSDSAPLKTVEYHAQPLNKVSKVQIRAHVKGLDNARGTTLSFLRGVSGGYYLGQDRPLHEVASQAFILNNRRFDEGSTTDGTICAQFSSFGLPLDISGRCYLDVDFILVNGESYPVCLDVTDMFVIHEDEDHVYRLILDLDLELELPQTQPDQDPGFFDDNVNPWEDVATDLDI